MVLFLRLLEKITYTMQLQLLQTSQQNQNLKAKRMERPLHRLQLSPIMSCQFPEGQPTIAPFGILPPSFVNFCGVFRNQLSLYFFFCFFQTSNVFKGDLHLLSASKSAALDFSNIKNLSTWATATCHPAHGASRNQLAKVQAIPNSSDFHIHRPLLAQRSGAFGYFAFICA